MHVSLARWRRMVIAPWKTASAWYTVPIGCTGFRCAGEKYRLSPPPQPIPAPPPPTPLLTNSLLLL
uniref:Secreted protein n=1 Tax=Echinococcus granulosus TaxID=6210 RepID=A0A068WYM2_ECHGR|nr:hypothetical protein EgrG_000092700 [Echinococcus granulosus]